MTKKNKILSFILGICVFVPAIFMITACGHTHKALAEWSTDETYHWHACEGKNCTEVLDKAEHIWDEGVITTPATFATDGVKTYTCICGKTRTEKVVFNEITDVNFEKNTVAELSYITINITEENKGTYYFKYEVSDVADDTRECYWINVSKVGGTLSPTDVSQCKIYDNNKQIIKDTVYTQAAGQFLATREGSGDGYDSHETIVKLKQDGTHYFELTFNTVGEYKIHVTHFGPTGSNLKWATPTTYSSSSFTSTKQYLYSDRTYWYSIELTQDIIDQINACGIDGGFYGSDDNKITTVSIEAYDSNGNMLLNESIADGETESNSVSVFDLEPGTYYICVKATANCYGYLSVTVA